MKDDLCSAYVLCSSKWIDGINEIAARSGESGHPHLLGDTSNDKH